MRSARVWRPVTSTRSRSNAADVQRLWQTLPVWRTFSSSSPSSAHVAAAEAFADPSAASSSLASLRSTWLSAPSPPLTPTAASASSLSSAEQRAVSLAQREAEGERRRSALPSTSAATAAADRLTARSQPPMPVSQRPSPALSPLLHPLTGPAGSGNELELSEAEEAEQLALIDELTDYIRAYRHPVDDRGGRAEDRSAAAADSQSAAVPHEDDYFLGRPRTTLGYNRLIQRHAEAGAVQQGLAMLQSMSRRGVTADSATYSALVRVCGAAAASVSAEEKAQLLRRAFSLLDDMKQAGLSPTVAVFNSLIDTCTRLSSSEQARSVLRLMAEHGVSADVVTYTSLLSLYRDPAVSVDQLKQLWYDLRNSGHQPDAVAYNTAIRAVAQHGEAEYALMLFSDMQQDGVHPSTYTYNALMYACARRPDFYIRAFDLFQQAMAQQHTLDKHSYSILLYAAARNRDVGNAIKLFEQMEAAGVERDTAAYNTMLHCIANSQSELQCKLTGSVLDMSQRDRMVMVERLLVQMEANSVPIDDRTVLAALRVWTEALRLRTAESKRTELITRYIKLDREQQRQQGRGDFDVRLWEAMLQMYGRARRTKEVVALLQRLETEGLLASLRSHVLQRLLHVCTQRADEASGVWLLEAMRRVNVQPSSEHDERLLDSGQYRQWLQRQHSEKRQGAVPRMADSDRQQLSDRAWFGSKALKRPRSSESSDGSQRKWLPSREERKAREKAETRRRKTDKRLAWESR